MVNQRVLQVVLVVSLFVSLANLMWSPIIKGDFIRAVLTIALGVLVVICAVGDFYLRYIKKRGRAST
jgi:hypothetical protein